MTQIPSDIEVAQPGGKAARAGMVLPGVIALSIGLVGLVPLTFAAADSTWLALTILAVALLFWWMASWVAGGAGTPPVALIGPAALLMVLIWLRPAIIVEAMLRLPQGGALRQGVLAATWVMLLEREATGLATQKLVVGMLMAIPLGLVSVRGRWALDWLAVVLLGALAGMGVVALARGEHAGPAEHLAAFCGAGLIFAVAVLAAQVARGRAGGTNGQWRSSPAMLELLLAAVVMVMLAGAVFVGLGMPAVGRGTPGGAAAGWALLGVGLGMAALLRPAAARAVALALAGGGTALIVLGWGMELPAAAFRDGGWTGAASWDPAAGETAGLLHVVRWRGLAGLGLLIAALAWTIRAQWRSLRGPADPWQHILCRGAMAASWLMAAGWLLGPARVGGAPALLALAFWSLSRAAGDARTPRPAVGLQLGVTALLVVLCYGLLGLLGTAHAALWLNVPVLGGDKILHAIWGAFVTLACALAFLTRGRWIAVIAGLALSLTLAFGGEMIQKYMMTGRDFEWSDLAAYAIPAVAVSAALALIPFKWPDLRRPAGG